MADMLPGEPDQTIRLTLRWVVVGVILLFGIGILGGLLGQQLFAPPLPPLSGGTDRLVTNVQEVTISPNTATAQVITGIGRSVVLLGTRVGTTIQPVGTAAVLTNDGLLATTVSLPSGEVVALDDTGAATALDRVGEDTLYGISYWRMPQAVVVPLDVRREAVGVGSELLGVSRSGITRQLKAIPYRLYEYTLPRPSDGVGLQRVLQGPNGFPSLLVGAPLVDEEGRLAGLVLDTDGRAISADTVELSLRRVSAGQRELDPLATVGLGLEFSFASTAAAPDQLSFVPRIIAVTPASPAAQARLLRGDTITAINDEAVGWEKNVLQQLSAALPLRITVQRGEESIPVTLEAPVVNE